MKMVGVTILIIGFVVAVVISSVAIEPSPFFICLMYPMAMIGAKL